MVSICNPDIDSPLNNTSGSAIGGRDINNPDIVLVHYLNVPYNDDNKVISPALNYFADNKKEWTKDELICELKPMFFSENEPDLNNELEKSTVETIEAIVGQLMVKQRAKVKALEDSSDGGINAKALTVVNAITNSTRDVNNKQNMKSNNKCKQQPSAALITKRDVSTGIMTAQQHNSNNTDNNSSKQLTTQLIVYSMGLYSVFGVEYIIV
ncbi:unnamed protein product [Medioppia subpectinata]|uniref:Uncharacterized protein n=1 Tax=Medioppia subpectinata TaxID=1979941 RepID=A0A7R9KEH3_9ACAR|nr:unnamed protein product [Medioppia subpectinata]CAG2101104.1 unnamed protein product [Medioppia subpectinata]